MPRKPPVTIGERFGRLSIICENPQSAEEKEKLKRPILCRCSCGTEKVVYLATLKAGKAQSCGCIRTPKLEIGKRYGRLSVLKELPRGGRDNHRRILCQCDCGNEKIANLVSLEFGATKSCGCLQPEVAKQSKTTHGLSGTSLSVIFKGMKSRCYNKNNPYYRYYGGKGIVVCDEWLKGGLSVFSQWAVNNGWQKGLTIERNDYNDNYAPHNCSFATEKEQANNKSTTTWILENGRYISFAQFCEEYAVVGYSTALHRLHKAKWTPYQAATIPTSFEKRVVDYNGLKFSIKELCSRLNIKLPLVMERQLRGWSIERAVDMTSVDDQHTACLSKKPVLPIRIKQQASVFRFSRAFQTRQSRSYQFEVSV